MRERAKPLAPHPTRHRLHLGSGSETVSPVPAGSTGLVTLCDRSVVVGVRGRRSDSPRPPTCRGTQPSAATSSAPHGSCGWVLLGRYLVWPGDRPPGGKRSWTLEQWQSRSCRDSPEWLVVWVAGYRL